MASTDELWQQVVETPDDIGARLVLADALIESSNEADQARGELIALQCRGADASMHVGESPSEDNAAERVSELIAASWTKWLGDLSMLIVRQGSTFQNGMLSLVQVGGETTPPAAWTAFAGHRELCAVQRVRPYKVRADHYATFLAALTRDPPHVEVHAPLVIRGVRAKRSHWGVRYLRFGGIAWWSASGRERGILASEFRALSEIATELETIEMPPTHAVGDELADVAAWLPRMFPKLQRLRLEDGDRGWLGDSEPRLRAMKFVEFV
jgi:uncharacterized protein (TIGR02996 family)